MDQHSEEWRPVVGYEGAYEVSDQGRVRSLDRVGRDRWGERIYRGRVLIPDANARSGHLRVTLCGTRPSHMFVHRLVLEAFTGPCPGGMECCHNDGDPTNNRVSNLRWDTHSGNIRDKRKHGTDHYAIRSECSRGHEYTEGTTYLYNGTRYCRTCLRDDARKRRASSEGAEAHRAAARRSYWRSKSQAT